MEENGRAYMIINAKRWETFREQQKVLKERHEKLMIQ
jgi:hypothetical protein